MDRLSQSVTLSSNSVTKTNWVVGPFLARKTDRQITTPDSLAIYDPQQKINCTAIWSTSLQPSTQTQVWLLLYIYGKTQTAPMLYNWHIVFESISTTSKLCHFHFKIYISPYSGQTRGQRLAEAVSQHAWTCRESVPPWYNGRKWPGGAKKRFFQKNIHYESRQF